MAVPIADGAVSHRRVEPSTSVNKNVTVPDGAPTPQCRAPPPGAPATPTRGFSAIGGSTWRVRAIPVSPVEHNGRPNDRVNAERAGQTDQGAGEPTADHTEHRPRTFTAFPGKGYP